MTNIISCLCFFNIALAIKILEGNSPFSICVYSAVLNIKFNLNLNSHYIGTNLYPTKPFNFKYGYHNKKKMVPCWFCMNLLLLLLLKFFIVPPNIINKFLFKMNVSKFMCVECNPIYPKLFLAVLHALLYLRNIKLEIHFTIEVTSLASL